MLKHFDALKNIIAMYKSTISGVFKTRQTFHAAYDNFQRAREKSIRESGQRV